MDDVCFDKAGIGFRIRHSKTDQCKKRSPSEIRPFELHGPLSHVGFEGIFRFEKPVPEDFFLFFFLSFRRKSFDMISILGRPKCALVALGLYGVHFGTHSFRPGAASTAVVIES